MPEEKFCYMCEYYHGRRPEEYDEESDWKGMCLRAGAYTKPHWHACDAFIWNPIYEDSPEYIPNYYINGYEEVYIHCLN